MLRQTAVWDVIYEHPWYFTSPVLRALLQKSGFDVLDIGTAFGGQYLFAEARPTAGRRPAEPADSQLAQLTHDARQFSERSRAAIDTWADWLAAAELAGRRTAVWGIGSKGTTFLNVVPGASRVPLVIDLNPHKHGRHVPGTGQAVAEPGDLRSCPVDAILVMNPLYVEEVRETVSALGVRADVLAVASGTTR